jgi:hypothetical protein
MNNADEILLIILSSVLIILLLLIIWGLVYLVQFLKKAKQIATSAEKVVNSAETVAGAFKNVSGPIALFRLVNNLGKMVVGHKEGYNERRQKKQQ